MANPKFETYFLPSFPPPIKALEGRLQRESIGFENKWIPARTRSAGLAGMTAIYAMSFRHGTLVDFCAGVLDRFCPPRLLARDRRRELLGRVRRGGLHAEFEQLILELGCRLNAL